MGTCMEKIKPLTKFAQIMDEFELSRILPLMLHIYSSFFLNFMLMAKFSGLDTVCAICNVPCDCQIAGICTETCTLNHNSLHKSMQNAIISRCGGICYTPYVNIFDTFAMRIFCGINVVSSIFNM